MKASRSLAGLLFAICVAMPGHAPISGTVSDDAGPLAGATVGWQGESDRAVTDERGRFRLPFSAKSRRLTASKPGHIIASGLGPSLHLKRLPSIDNNDYAWIDPHPDPASPNNCGNCHGEIHREWRASAHAHAATNPKFLGLYAPDAKTWNARLEHPDGSAVCAKCHAPTLDSPSLEYDVRAATGVTKSGIHCDYCHKIADAPPGKFGTRFGRDGLELLRPKKGETLTFGPLDDAIRLTGGAGPGAPSSPLPTGGEGPGVRGWIPESESFVHAPFYKQSRYCASCHEGIVFGVHAYGTYSEWLESPAGKAGVQCQDCHMATTGRFSNIAPGRGGIERDPKTLASHRMPDAASMLRKSIRLDARWDGGDKVEVVVTAERVGHRVPTGFADRQLLLVVEAFNAAGKRVALLEGPALLKAAGTWARQPGVLYAKQLIGANQRTPSPFWLPVFTMLDTRLRPEQPDTRTFVFDGPPSRVIVRLWYRRFWQEVADERGWTDNDAVVAERTLAPG